MTKFATQLTAFCLFGIAFCCGSNAQAADYPYGVSEAEFSFLLGIGMVNEADLCRLEVLPQNVPVKTARTTLKPTSGNGLAGLNYGPGRIIGLSGTDLGSGR